MIKSFFEEIFPYEKFPVEYLSYRQLVESQPQINYLAIPWAQILNSTWLDFPNKKNINFYFSELLKINIEQQNNTTVCQHDDYMKLLPFFRHLKINTVFSPLHDINNKIDDIRIIPISLTNNFHFNKNTNKDILFSFVGTHITHDVRLKMFNMVKGPYMIYRNTYHVDSGVLKDKNHKLKEETEYKDILERSRFSLCPRGSSPSSVRFWECLAAGSIPIVISDNWVLPDWDWKKTIIQIPEQEFQKMDYNDIKSFLLDIDYDKQIEMRTNCLKANEKFKKENYGSYIVESLNI